MILPGFHRQLANDKWQELVKRPGVETITRQVLDDCKALEK